MKQIALLLLLLPLFAVSQQAQIGVRINGQWYLNSSIVTEANGIMDSIGSEIEFMSATYQNDSVLNLFGILSGKVVSDRMMIRVTGDKMYTANEIATGACYNTCRPTICSSACWKTVSCGCACSSGGGACEQVWTGYGSMTVSLGSVLRLRLIY